MPPHLPHCILYIPCKGRFLEKVPSLSRQADAIILDLEDSIPQEDKKKAEELAITFLEKIGDQPTGRLFIRIDGKDAIHAARRFNHPAVNAIIIPKAEHPAEIADIAQTIPNKHIMPIIETPAGVLNVQTILSASDNITGVFFGAQDFTYHNGTFLLENAETRIPRMLVAMAAHAAHIPAFDSPWPSIDASDAMKQYFADSAALGFCGCAVIHPNHIRHCLDAYGHRPKKKRAEMVIRTGSEMCGPDRTMFGPPAKKALQEYLEESETLPPFNEK